VKERILASWAQKSPEPWCENSSFGLPHIGKRNTKYYYSVFISSPDDMCGWNPTQETWMQMWRIPRGSLNTPNQSCTCQSSGLGQHQKSQSLGPPTLAYPDPGLPQPWPVLILAFLKVARPYNPFWVHFGFKVQNPIYMFTSIE
jgi:hypothetical protein